MAIPLPGQPGQAFLTGLNTGGNLFGQMMAPVISREQMVNQKMLQEQRLAQALQQHKDNLAMQHMVQQGLQSRHADNLAVKQGNLALKREMFPYDLANKASLASFRQAQTLSQQEKLKIEKLKLAQAQKMFPLQVQRLLNQTKNAEAQYNLNYEKYVAAQRGNNPEAAAKYYQDMMSSAQEIAQSQGQLNALSDEATTSGMPPAENTSVIPPQQATSREGISHILSAPDAQPPVTAPTMAPPMTPPPAQVPQQRPMTQAEKQHAAAIYKAATGVDVPVQTPEEIRSDKVKLKEEEEYNKEFQENEKALIALQRAYDNAINLQKNVLPLLTPKKGEQGQELANMWGPRTVVPFVTDQQVLNYRKGRIKDPKILEAIGAAESGFIPILSQAASELSGNRVLARALKAAEEAKFNWFDPFPTATGKMKSITKQFETQLGDLKKRQNELRKKLGKVQKYNPDTGELE